MDQTKAGPKICKVCEVAQSKYKCPVCVTPYCSLPCFKKHKETPCAKPLSISQNHSPDATTRGPVVHLDQPYCVGEPDELLQQSQLEAIASSSEIRDILKDEKLQKLIAGVASSTDSEKELDKAMEVDAFRIFSEKILSVIASGV